MRDQYRSGLQTVQLEERRTVNVLAICAGVGGLELGLSLALHHRGEIVRGVGYLEREAGAAASLVASMEAGWLHHAPVWSDARTFDGTAWRGCVDIVTSGDPCQGNSVAGKRRGELDDRWLLDRAIDIFDASGADTFFRENVPGNADGQLAVAIPALERLGCRIAVGIFSSAETGNTQGRERLIILAHRDSGGRARGEEPDERAVQPRQQASLRHDDERRRSPVGHPVYRNDAGLSADPQRRSQRRTASERASPRDFGCLPPAVIPGPSDNRGWIDLLDRYPEYQPALSEEEAQSHLRRGIDAMAHRVERLRATGNGVDPITAAYAYLCLSERLRSCRVN